MKRLTPALRGRAGPAAPPSEGPSRRPLRGRLPVVVASPCPRPRAPGRAHPSGLPAGREGGAASALTGEGPRSRPHPWGGRMGAGRSRAPCYPLPVAPYGIHRRPSRRPAGRDGRIGPPLGRPGRRRPRIDRPNRRHAGRGSARISPPPPPTAGAFFWPLRVGAVDGRPPVPL